MMAKSKKQTAYEHKLNYNNAYNRENYRSFSIRYHKNDEKHLIQWIEKQEGIKNYITNLIIKDMNKKTKETAKVISKKKK